MARLLVKDLVVRYGGVTAVANLDLSVDHGELVTLLGPSGCGKTTTLRCLAGLERQTSGTIQIDDEMVAGPTGEVPPERRNVNMVFQNYAVWPHMTVFDNVAFGLRLMSLSRAEVRRRSERALGLVGLGGLADRYGTELSGGQQQRVALARAVVTEPRLLLFDEPLSNLDAALREQMRIELRDLHDRLGKTAIYVTHDQTEAMVMSDRVVLMKDGKIVQQGPPRELFERPRTRFAAEFLGVANIWDATVAGSAGQGLVEVVVARDGSRLRFGAQDSIGVGRRGAVGIRSDRFALTTTPPPTPERNAFHGRIERMSYLGNSSRYEVRVDEHVVRAETHPRLGLTIGDTVWLSVEPDAITWLDDDGTTVGSDSIDSGEVGRG